MRLLNVENFQVFIFLKLVLKLSLENNVANLLYINVVVAVFFFKYWPPEMQLSYQSLYDAREIFVLNHPNNI